MNESKIKRNDTTQPMSILQYVTLQMLSIFLDYILITPETVVNCCGYGGDSERAKFVFH